MNNIKMEVQYTDGYEKRFTEAILEQLEKKNKNAGLLLDHTEADEKASA